MSDTTKTELELLKERADRMSITYHPNIGLEALKKKIGEKLNGLESDEPEEEATPEAPVKETAQKRRMRLNKEARILKRVRITCMNPNKKQMQGELFTISNSVVGTIKRFVPFDAEDGWHVEAMLLKMIKARKYQSFYQVKVNGKKVTRGKLVPEFAIEEMKPLTPKQLEDLAKRQAVSGTIGED